MSIVADSKQRRRFIEGEVVDGRAKLLLLNPRKWNGLMNRLLGFRPAEAPHSLDTFFDFRRLRSIPHTGEVTLGKITKARLNAR